MSPVLDVLRHALGGQFGSYTHWCVALSGGLDSTVLLHALCVLRAEYPDLWEELRHHQTRHNQAVEILIERGIGEGYLKAVNPRVAALALRGALGAVTQAGTVQANTFTADSAAQDVFELFLRGLLTESGATALEHVT